jgi:hypothetical protein
MSASTTWRIGGWLNLIQTTFVGLLRVLSVPIVLGLSVASGYTTYYGLSYFITPWIALTITIAVQSIIVICSLEIAGMHFRANPGRFLSILLSLLVALTVSVTFSYFKFYEFSERETVLLDREARLEKDIGAYLEGVVALKAGLSSEHRKRIDTASRETKQAFLSAAPGMAGQKVGKGKTWSYFNEILGSEQNRLKNLESQLQPLDHAVMETRISLLRFSSASQDMTAYNLLVENFQRLIVEADQVASNHGRPPISAPRIAPFQEFSRQMTPSFDMWKNISWFAFACAAMVDFFTLILSYRLETTAPGPLNAQEKDLAFEGLRQFSQFRVNENNELEFSLDQTELERARRVSQWHRMFTVAFLLNRGYLRKRSRRIVEFAPNLYPIIAERLRQIPAKSEGGPMMRDALADAMQRKFHG